jgi:hypothetical protein
MSPIIRGGKRAEKVARSSEKEDSIKVYCKGGVEKQICEWGSDKRILRI